MSSAPHDPRGSRVVLVGAHTFEHLAPLPAVARNLSRLRELLTDPEVWGLPAENCVVIEQPDHRDLVLDALTDATAAATDLVLLYYAGHGLVSPDTEDLLLSLPRCRPERPYTALPFQEIRDVLRAARRVPAKAVLLDCCFAGRALAGAMGPDDVRLTELSRVEGSYVLAAASATRQAIAPVGGQYTAFTGQLIDVLENGVPGGPKTLDLATVHAHLHRTLPELGFPRPRQRNEDQGARIVLGWNRHPSAAAAAPRLPAHLRDLLHAQTIAARNFTYRLYDAPLDGLATVYVRQQARSAPTAPTRQPLDRIRDPRRNPREEEHHQRHFVSTEPSGTAIAPARAAEDTLGRHRHVLITGGAGQGKSTLSLQLAASLALAYESGDAQGTDGERLLPLRVTAGRLAAGRSALIPRLVRILSAELAPHLDYALPDDLLDHLPENTTCLLIVDGLDEITDPERRRGLVAELAGRVRNPDGRFRLLITTRPLPNDELAPLQHAATGTYTLEPFDREQLREFAHRWFRDHPDGPTLAAGFLRQTEAAGVRDLVRVPLLATVAALVYRKHPTTPLPSNRFTLYCDYFTLLTDAHLEEMHEQQQTVLQRWTLRPAVHRSSVAFLFDHRPELVEHLAVTVVTDPTAGTRPLLDLALDWLDEHDCRATRRGVPEWPRLVASVLGTVGVFTHHHDFLRFTHYSFAEHLAADVRADRLPPHFDPAAPDWTHTVHRAVHGDLFAHAILAHHAHRYGTGDAILDWLGRGTGDFAALAGELLARGVPAANRHAESFAANLMSTLARESSDEELRRAASNAAALLGEPAVRRTLFDFLGSRYRKHDVRVRLAQSLTSHDTTMAIDILRGVLDREGISLDTRISAMRALAACGSAHVAEATEALWTALRSDDATAANVIDAASGLASLAPEHKDAAVTALRTVLADATSTGHECARAARALAEIDPTHGPEAAKALREVQTGSHNSPYDRIFAAEQLAALGPAYTGEAADVLRALIVAPNTNVYVHRQAIRSLAGLGPGQTLEAAQLLRADLAARNISDDNVAETAMALAELAPVHANESIDALLRLLALPTVDTVRRCGVAQSLTRLDPSRLAEAAEVIRRVLTAPTSAASKRINAAATLGHFGPDHVTEAATYLQATLAATDVTAADRRIAAEHLARLGPTFVPAAARELREVLTAPDAGPWERMEIPRCLSGLDAIHIPEAIDTLTRMFDDPNISPSYRNHIAIMLIPLAPDDLDSMASRLRSMLSNPDTALRHRAETARTLHTLGGGTDEVAEVLRATLYASDADAGSRREAAQILGYRHVRYMAESTAALRDLLSAPDADPETRAWAATDLSDRDPDDEALAANTLREMAACRTIRPVDRAFAVQLLATFGQGYTEEAAATSRALLHTPGLSAHTRIAVARVVVMISPACTSDAVSSTRDILRDPATQPVLRRVAARNLGDFGAGYLDEASDALWSIITAPDIDPTERCRAAHALHVVGTARRDELAQTLRTILTDPSAASLARTLAAHTLGRLGRGYVHEGADHLRAILAAPDLTSSARAKAAAKLADLGQGFQAEGVTTLQLLLTSTDTRPDEQITVARRLFKLSRQSLPDIATTLRAVLAAPDATPYTRTRAARLLGTLSPRFLDEAAEHLRRIPAAPATPPVATRRAATALGMLSPRFRPEAAAILRALPAGDLTVSTSYARRAVARLLRDFGQGYELPTC
ncbi:caspase, EACC1-associated type [Embleya hyalina]|uniref:Protein kinase-like protein n=1 Tax=Embleya hyalina TaxID=516124 RepID=A0A401YJM0_9ACTN|nr:NACHT domain-containing protein [Embleya hyalina]GCD94777.1 protein kinase-like protein [Embleya hyalina]